jgi:hypothetical protein
MASEIDNRTNDFWFRDANSLYLAESSPFDSHIGLQKWMFNGTTWQYQYNLLTSPIAYLSGLVDASGTTVLFATTGAKDDSLLRIVDGGSEASSTTSLLATAATDTSFHGVAFIATPEPATLILVAIGAGAAFHVAKKRRRVASAKVWSR